MMPGCAPSCASASAFEEVEGAWLIGCDGPHSAVRGNLGIGFVGSTYPELFVLADIKLRADFADAEARVFLGEKGALAFFPMAKEPLAADRHQFARRLAPEPSLAQCQAWSMSAARAASRFPTRVGPRSSGSIAARPPASARVASFSPATPRISTARLAVRA